MTQATAPAAGASITLPAPVRTPRIDRRSTKWAVRIIAFVAVIALWEYSAGPMNRALFAPPSEVLAAANRQFITERTIWAPIRDSVFVLFVGLGGGLLLGIPLGLVMGRSKRIHFVLDPYVTFLYVIPSVAFVPLLILWLGFNQPFQIALVFESALFPIMINAAAGAQNVEPDLIDGGRSFRASQWQIMRTIVVPASLPFIFAGIRIAFSAAWVGVVVAQMTGALAGLGGMILRAAATFRTADMLVPILVIMAIGVTIHALTTWLHHRLTPWHRPEGNVGA
ncbi:MAG: NitT/TauT family transport system permease protein [Chloroflexota bacterium]|nr:NitT/TauT family transport system permease protein [Chloroflexota bacterium]